MPPRPSTACDVVAGDLAAALPSGRSGRRPGADPGVGNNAVDLGLERAHPPQAIGGPRAATPGRPDRPPPVCDPSRGSPRAGACTRGSPAIAGFSKHRPVSASDADMPRPSRHRSLRLTRSARRRAGGRPAAPPESAGRDSTAAAPSWSTRPAPPRPRPASSPGCAPGRRLPARPPAGRRSPGACGRPSGVSPETLLAGDGTSPSHSSTAAG